MKIGDNVWRKPQTFQEPEKGARASYKEVEGTVVYIHPLGRYHTVEFQTPGGKIRESFQGVGP